MTRKYPNLLSPLKIGNVVLRNRLTALASKPHFIQGPEPYPAEGLITHFANKAKNGAALVTCLGFNGATGYTGLIFNNFDIHNPPVLNYVSQLSEAVHFYGAKALMFILQRIPSPFDVSQGPVLYPGHGTDPGVEQVEVPEELLKETADRFLDQAVIAQECGFDGLYLHMAYRLTLFGRFLSPLTNIRTDKYGGSLENRSRFPLMVCDLIKKKCGKDFLIEASISDSEPFTGGWTIEDSIEFAGMAEGLIDILQIRTGRIVTQHPAGFYPEASPNLKAITAITSGIRKNQTRMAVLAVGGFQDLDASEKVIASEQADLIGMARAWIADPQYGLKASEGRNEDVVPCIRCNKCAGRNDPVPWTSVCSVNPVWGLEHKIERMIEPPIAKKKVAVIGGGPAGMEAALIAAGRGHEVLLYEKSDALGGLLKTCENVSFKWPVRNFNNYLIQQIGKANVKVKLNTEVTPESLKKENFDSVLVAVGSEPIVPQISGIDAKKVVFAADVYGSEGTLAEDVLVIGGGEVGVETGMHLAEKGHRVTLLEMQDMLAPDAATSLAYRSMLMEAIEKQKNFKYILNACCTAISKQGITYRDKDGTEQFIKAGSVVIAAGMKPRTDQALQFWDAADRFYMIGDCAVAGNIQKVMRSAFSTASLL